MVQLFLGTGTGQLSGWYGYIAYVTGKPEVYLPGLILHALLAWASRH